MRHWLPAANPELAVKSSKVWALFSKFRGHPFAEWSDPDSNIGEADPGDVPGSCDLLHSFVVLLGFGIGCSAGLSPGALGSLSSL